MGIVFGFVKLCFPFTVVLIIAGFICWRLKFADTFWGGVCKVAHGVWGFFTAPDPVPPAPISYLSEIDASDLTKRLEKLLGTVSFIGGRVENSVLSYTYGVSENVNSANMKLAENEFKNFLRKKYKFPPLWNEPVLVSLNEQSLELLAPCDNIGLNYIMNLRQNQQSCELSELRKNTDLTE